jgi:3-hydroxymyristoyl/3-hydroxydecanoyl-(acyl carrier protein) dehydratase
MPEILDETRDGDSVTLRLRVQPELAHFAGHFPGLPILPGIVQTDWAVRLGRRHFGGLDNSLGIDQLKFQAMVRPGMELTLSLTHDAARHTLQFAYRDAHRTYSSGRIRFEIEA